MNREDQAVKESDTLPDRFWAKVMPIPYGACWFWTGTTCNQGYGRIWAGGDQVANLCAHRVSYTLLRKSIPEGLEIDHLCQEKGCVNPQHLEPVTHQENERRKHEAAPPQSSFRCGHPFEPDNWYTHTDGSRYCRRCHLLRCKERRESA